MLRNALLPIVTVIGYQFGTLLGGAVLTETVFGWPGMGQLLVDALFARDYPVVQGIVLTFAVLFILVNLGRGPAVRRDRPANPLRVSPALGLARACRGAARGRRRSALPHTPAARDSVVRASSAWRAALQPQPRRRGRPAHPVPVRRARAGRAAGDAYDPEQTQLDQKLLEPSAAHLLGTDHLGRDILARLAYGARFSLLIGFAAVSVGLVIGVPLGAICAASTAAGST